MQVVIGLVLLAASAVLLRVSIPRGGEPSWVARRGMFMQSAVPLAVVFGVAMGLALIVAGLR